MKPLINIFFLSSLIFFSSRSTLAQDPIQFTFGLSDLRSECVIVTNHLSEPPKELRAIRSASDCQLSLIRIQEESKSYNGRQIPQRFDQMPGPIYRAEKPCLPAGETVFLVTNQFLKTNKYLPLQTANSTQISHQTISRIESAKGLKATSAWRIADIPGVGTISTVIFEPKDDTILLSLVFTSEDKILFRDYPGDLNDEGSRWRVDDGGEFSHVAFSVIAAFQGPRGLLLVTTWAGFEGENASILAERGSTLEQIGDGYRYWIPE